MLEGHKWRVNQLVSCGFSPGTTLFHRKPDSVSYLAGSIPSSPGGLFDPADEQSSESRLSFAVEGLWGSTTPSSENWWEIWGSDEEASPWRTTPLESRSDMAL